MIIRQRNIAAHSRFGLCIDVGHEEEMPSKLSVATMPVPDLETAQDLCRNPGNFSQGEQTYSEANTPSIINSLALSFPRGNHSTQQTETEPAARDLLLLLPRGKDDKLAKTHKYH